MALKSPSKDPHKSYKDTHWGVESKEVFRAADQPGMPNTVTEMGKLIELRVRSGRERFAVRFDDGGDTKHTRMTKGGKRKCVLAYDAPPATRLYLILNPAARADAQATLIQDADWYDLAEIAAHVGGRQAKREDREVLVQPIGYVTHVIYLTEKTGDGVSQYIHRMGEEGGIEPMLCVDTHGALYIAGGSYSVKNAGIIH